MLLNLTVNEKSFGPKHLYAGLSLSLVDGEKAGVIGRNGSGKSTMLGIINQTDKDFDGELKLKKGVLVASSRQEHTEVQNQKVIEYILNDTPDYAKLKGLIEGFAEIENPKNHQIQNYSDALSNFGEKGFYELEGKIMEDLKRLGISNAMAEAPLAQLSGGQKRLVEVIKVANSGAHIMLLDEPTNHMDYHAKLKFIDWLKSTNSAVVVVTHDRDVLEVVNRIIEIKDGKALNFPGNYQAYLKQNAVKTSSAANEYEIIQRKIVKLKDDIIRFKRLKEKARDPDTIQRFKSLQLKAEKEAQQLEAIPKPTMWVDKESKDLHLKKSQLDKYEKYKASNIKLKVNADENNVGNSALIKVDDLSLGYKVGDDIKILFEKLKFSIGPGERVNLKGRNGAGKTTLVNLILDLQNNIKPKPVILEGLVELNNKLRIGYYQQEIEESLLSLSLSEAIEELYKSMGMPITEQQIKGILKQYLFDPQEDFDKPVVKLSGGQKARLQIIKMLANKPNLLILDEPTNHLDLPSIEELEEALLKFNGALLYISHDQFFCNKMGGEVVKI
jgi:ATP-binding cassette subfamily F protein 3